MKPLPYRCLGLLALSVLLGGSLPAQKMIIEYDHSVDLTKLRKYSWKEHPFLKARPESRRFVVGGQLVQSDSNDILMKRGYRPDDDQPEFYITHFITARMGTETHTEPVAGFPEAYMWPGSWYSWSGAYFSSWESWTENYLEGILLLDVVDAKTNRLLWRAALKDKIDDMKERHKNVEDAVKKAWKKFPPEYKPKK